MKTTTKMALASPAFLGTAGLACVGDMVLILTRQTDPLWRTLVACLLLTVVAVTVMMVINAHYAVLAEAWDSNNKEFRGARNEILFGVPQIVIGAEDSFGDRFSSQEIERFRKLVERGEA